MSTLTIQEDQPAVCWPGFDDDAFAKVLELTPAPARRQREAAFKAYLDIPTPTSQTEEWRRTNPALFPFGKVASLSPLVERSPGAAQPEDTEHDIVISVDDEGYSIADAQGLITGGQVRILSLEQAATSAADVLEAHFRAGAFTEHSDKVEELADAFWNFGLLIHVGSGCRLERGILIRHDHSATAAALVSRLLIVLDENAALTLVEHDRSANETPFLAVGAKEMYVGEGSHLKVITVKEWGDRAAHLASDMARVERDAKVELINLNFGSKVSKLKFGSDVAGPGAAAELDGIFLVSGKQHIDQTSLQIHSSPDTYSRLLYKGAARDKGRSVYRGIIQARPGAIRVDAYQTNNNIVLSDGARVDTIPGLLIDADDLKCSHGATIGNLDSDQVFYLRTRGLSEAEARRIVIAGFYDEIIERIPYAYLQDRAHVLLAEKLGDTF